MHISRLVISAAVLLMAAPVTRLQGQAAGPLRVIRTSPVGGGPVTSRITVTFDRPVAGSLDRTIDPATILRVEPAIAGKIEWRDPVTIRLTPSGLLSPGQEYTVTVGGGFRAMDGTSLAAPYGFHFRAQGPVLIGGSPLAPRTGDRVQRLVPAQRFDLVYSSPVDLPTLAASAYVELSATCAGQRTIRVSATSQRRIRDGDPYPIQQAGGWQRDRATDTLRRVVQLVPESPLPLSCRGELVAPAEVAPNTSATPERLPFDTYGDFRIAEVTCSNQSDKYCATGPLTITFSNPVRGVDVLRKVKLFPETKFTIGDSLAERDTWTLDARLKLHTGYAVVVDTSLRDIYGQQLRGNPAVGYKTGGYEPSVNYAYGRQVVERVGFRTLAVEHVNVDTLIVVMAQVPTALEARALGAVSWRGDSLWAKVASSTTTRRIAVQGAPDRPMITGLRLPTLNAMKAGTPTLFAIRVGGRSATHDSIAFGPTSIVQVTDLGVHVKMGVREGVVWVTGVNDGLARAGASVSAFDGNGKLLGSAKTDAQGIARFPRLLETASQPQGGDEGEGDDEGPSGGTFNGYVTATLGTDRAITVVNDWDPDLSPYHFKVDAAYGTERLPLAGALFTERGIYRPGERVYAKAIVRSGALGALRAAPQGDSIKWTFNNRDGEVLREIGGTLSSFGTADQSYELPSGSTVGTYTLVLQTRSAGHWQQVGNTSYRVAEYRPPEFLVDLIASEGTKLPGDKFTATAQARYLFGAPMGQAQVQWQARRIPVSPWSFSIPGLEDWYVGDSGEWWEDAAKQETEELTSRTDTLDARGMKAFTLTLPPSEKGRASRVTVDAVVTDVNRQVVGTSTSVIVHPAEFYIAARSGGDAYFWKAGAPQSISLITVKPSGERTSGVRISGTIVRREWHRVRRERDGVSELVGDWVSDTVAHCSATSAATPVACPFTPRDGGLYILTFAAKDSRGHVAQTSFQRWAEGTGWVPWSDETQFKMDVIPDRTRYSVGDTASVMFASPFVNADAWVVVEREGLIEQRRIRITSGSTTLKFPVTEAWAPNVFVSILVARGRSAKPGYLDDLGRPTIRVGYAEVRVTPEVKRLAVAVTPERSEYRPGDTARVKIHVQDAQHRGARSEVTLWAVDEGVLALTGYKTPDPIDLIYQPRGLGMRLASNMTAVAPQVPEGEKGWRAAGGGGGVAGADILRSKFKTTAFFIASVVTDAAGNATASAKLPDNITTFRVMAVAVTTGDRFGKGQSPMLVTRPLLARQALPRFVRPGDSFTAGAVINRRDGAAVPVTVHASATSASLRGDSTQVITLAAQRGAEVRFPFLAARAESASFRFDVSDTRNADAVRATIPVRPEYHPVVHTLAGVLHDTATVDLPLPAGMDLDRSRLTLQVGSSPLATIRGMQEALRVYPYYCSEQVISAAIPIIALFRAEKDAQRPLQKGNPKAEIARAVEMLSSRQRTDGGIGYWSAEDWTTPWLSAYAGLVILDARDAGAGVRPDTMVLHKLAAYLTSSLHGGGTIAFVPVAHWNDTPEARLREQTAAVDFLSRYGHPDIAAENELIRSAAQLSIEDRSRLAEVLMRRRQVAPARALMQPTWNSVRVEGRTAAVPVSETHYFYFDSRSRPVARILTATIAVDPTNALIGPLTETLVEETRAENGRYIWNTQDYGAAVTALAAVERMQRAQGERSVRVRAGSVTLMQGGAAVQSAIRDSSIALGSVVSAGAQSLKLSLDAGAGTAPVFYYLALTEIPVKPPVTPEDRGIQVERWYERISAPTPIATVAEGELVRVRLRITVPSMRYFVVVDDALPAGLEAVDLSLRTASALPGPGVKAALEGAEHQEVEQQQQETRWFGRWDSGWWSAFDHREIRDDRVVYSANVLWPGTYTATYIARATTPGTFIRPPAHAEEMYNPGVNGRSDGGTLVVTSKGGAH